MNKWISISIICVLVAGLAASLFLYFQESSNLKATESEIVTLEGNVSTLEGTVSTLEGDLAAAEAEVSRLEGELSASEAEVTRLEGELSAAQAEVSRLEGELSASEAEVTRLEGDLADAQAEVSRLEGELADAQAEVSTLQADLSAAQAEISTLSEELTKVQKDPRHFASLAELTSWLEQDDTDTEYSSESIYKFIYLLQDRALRDGYLLPAHFEDFDLDYIIDIAGNLAYIGGEMYLVWPYGDTYTLWFYGASISPHTLEKPFQGCTECHYPSELN